MTAAMTASAADEAGRLSEHRSMEQQQQQEEEAMMELAIKVSVHLHVVSTCVACTASAAWHCSTAYDTSASVALISHVHSRALQVVACLCLSLSMSGSFECVQYHACWRT